MLWNFQLPIIYTAESEIAEIHASKGVETSQKSMFGGFQFAWWKLLDAAMGSRLHWERKNWNVKRPNIENWKLREP